MQKLWLKNFEFQINPATWNTGQDLVQAGGVRALQEVEKHFWVMSVQDGSLTFEVEIMITPHKIKAFTCECWAEGRRLMCAHVAAGLLKIRQFLEQQSESRQVNSVSKKEEHSNRLNVQTVLNNTEPEDLLDFVRNYARRDRDFALALKTSFAGKLTGIDNPFLLVIDAALPRHAGARPLREPELRRLRKVLDDLNQQMTTAVEHADANTIFQLATAVLQKTKPVLVQLEEAKNHRLGPYLQTAVEQLLKLPSELLSPELQEKRRDFLFEYIQSDKQGIAVSEPAILDFLGQAATDDRFFEQIRDLFDRTPYPAPPAILHLFLIALAQRKLPEAIIRVLQDYTERPNQVKAALEMLYQLKRWEAILLAGAHYLDQPIFNSWQQREVEDWLLEAAEKSGDKTRLKAFLRRRYSNQGAEEIYSRLKNLAGASWPKESKQLLGVLKKAGNPNALANFLAAEKDLDGLVKLLQEQGKLSLLKQYEEAFLPERAAFIRDFYLEKLAAYLSEHFGRQATEQVFLELKGLAQKGQTGLVKEIVTALAIRFPDRQTLAEDLAGLFPKAKRSGSLLTF